jgi:hypothetical protein
MTPDQIKSFVAENYPGLVPEPRRSPDGWSFYYRTVRRGSNPNRIARVIQRRPGAPVLFKPAVSARLAHRKKLEIQISGGPGQVQELVERELALWHAHFEAGRISAR